MIRHTLLRQAGATAIAAALAFCPTGACAQSTGARPIELPAQDLGAALREVASRSGVNLVVPAELVRGRRSPRLSGRYTTDGAIEALLAGSGLVARKVDGSLVITRAAGTSAEVEGAPTGPEIDSSEIVVTGTNLRGGQPTSPLIRIDRAEIDRTGATSVEQLMRKVPQNMQGGVSSENFGAPLAGADLTEHGAGLNLRGLGQRATLVLVNGRRLAPSGAGSFVDVSLIPLSAVERVEILTDGASAIYGSDAVGGVVNFLLRDDFEGLETLVHAGSATEGDGDQLQLGVAAGLAWGSGRSMLAYEYRLEDEIRAADRDFTINLTPNESILPRERRHSLFGLVQQELAPGLHSELTGSLARRRTQRTYYFTGSPLPIGAEAEAEAANVAGEIRYGLGAGWLARIEAIYSLSTTEQRQTQPGGEELVNARDTRNEIFEGALKLDGPLLELPAGPVRLALGTSLRREKYRDSFSSSFVPEFVQENRRSVRAAFAELLVPIVSSANRLPGVERLQVSAAGRYEHYTKVGSTFDPKLGLLWSPVPDLSLRASWGTSFRAPLLSESIESFAAIYFPARFLYLDPSQASGVGLVLQGNHPEIGPERSRTWTVGGEFKPRQVPGLTVSANYYSIRFSDRIAVPTSAIRVVGNPAFEPIIERSPSPAAVAALVGGAEVVLDLSRLPGGATPEDVTVVLDDRTANTAITTTSGVDLGLSYAFALGSNQLRLDASVTHVIDFTDRLTVASPAADVLDTTYQPLDWRGRAGLVWTRSSWSGSLFVNHADGYRDTRSAEVRPVDAHTSVDLSLAYTFGGEAEAAWLRGTRVALYAENLFDEDPPRLLPDPGQTAGIGYDPVNASGRGRLVTLQIRRKW